MDFLTLSIVVGIFAACILIMAVGLIIRKRSFTSCGCAKITFRGETIRCPACPDDEDGALEE